MWSRTRPSASWRVAICAGLATAAVPGCGERPAGSTTAGDARAPTPSRDGLTYAYIWHQLATPPVVPAGVDHLLVRAGEIAAVGGAGVTRLLPQSLEHLPEGHPVTLVYRVRQALNGVFEREPERIRDALLDAIERDRAALADRGAAWRGVQIDFDCPTRLLGSYAVFLNELSTAALAGQPGELSITSLPTWLDATAFVDVASACDWLVAQTYALTLPQRVEDPPRLATSKTIRRWCRAYDRLAARAGVQWVAGLPTYGQVLVFDETGQRRTIAADLTPTDAYAASDLRSATPPVRDGLQVQHRFDTAEGWTVRITAIDANGLATALRLVSEQDSPRCRGVAFFRLAHDGVDLALPADSVEAVLSGVSLVPQIESQLERRDGGWRLVIRNVGPAAYLAGAEPAVELRVQPPRRVFVHLPLGEPYVVERTLGGKKVGSTDVCGRIAFRVPFIGPQRSVTVPVIHVGESTLVRMAQARTGRTP